MIKKNNYIEYIKGDLPLIISAPHGGDEKPFDIKTREKGFFCKDDFTLELSYEIQNELIKQTNKKAHMILAFISREKIDLNRPKDEAFEDEKALVIYENFHANIEKAKEHINSTFKKGLYFDIHGQSHSHNCTEFGYLLDNDILKLEDKELLSFQNKSSIKTLSRFSKESFIEQLKGENSLGSLLSDNGFKSIPSTKIPYAKDGNYYEGIFNTVKHSSLDGGDINSIQIEFPYENCRDTKINRKKLAKAFVTSLIKFYKVHLNLDIKNF